MKKQVLIVIIICLIAIFVAGAYYFLAVKPVMKVEDKAAPQAKPAESDDSQAKDKQIINQMLNVKDIQECDKLTDEAETDKCRSAYIVKQAAQSGDFNKCQEAGQPSLLADCLAQASFSLAIQKKDKKHCAKIVDETYKENCLNVLAGMGVK